MPPPSLNKPIKTSSGLIRDSACRMCRLHETAEFVCLLGQGPVPCDAMIVGEAPGAREDDSGRPFVGRSGQLLRELMEEVGLEDVYITNANHCRPPDNRTPKKGEIAKCRPWLDYEIETVAPKVVLLLGGTALESALGVKGIKKARGQPIKKGNINYLPAYHPSYVLRDPRHRSTLKADLKKFAAMVDGGGIPTVKGLDYRILHSRLDIEDMFDDVESEELFVYDLETTSLSPWHGNVVSIGIGTSTKQWIILVNHPAWSLPSKTVDEIVERLDELPHRGAGKLAHYRSLGNGGTGKFKSNHNIKFDALWMKVHFGVDWYGDFDTMLADYILDENKLHGLDHCASERYGALDWDVPLSLKHGKTGTIEDHARYLALDLLYTHQLTVDMMKDLEAEPGIERVFYRLLMPVSKMMIDVEYDGVFVDSDKFDDAERYLRSQIAAAEIELNKSFPGVNWGSPQQVANVLFNQLDLPIIVTTEKGAPSTSESVLKQLAPLHIIPALILKRRGAAQQLSFFIEGWKPWLRRNRLHPSFKIHGTTTGRLSCENPNLQQVPRDPRIRSLITAPPGWELVEADLSQIELRVAAELSKDRELQFCFQTGIDVHWRTMITSLDSGEGENAEAVVQTAGMYLLQQGLSPDERGAKTLLAVFSNLSPGEKPTGLLQSCRENGPDKAARDRVGQLHKRSHENVSSGTEKSKTTEMLLALRQYNEARTSSPRRSNQERSSFELGMAMQILSLLHPSDAEKIDKDWKERRKKAKAVGFGFLFGMGYKKFVEYARDNYGIVISESDAKKLRDGFFRLYSSLPRWHNRQREFARRHGYVRSMFGRKRRLPRAMDKEFSYDQGEAERQAINSPVQSFASDLNLAGAVELSSRHSRSYFRIAGTVHDSILMYVRKDKLKMVVADILKTMSHPALLDEFEIELSIPIEADVKIGPWSLGISPQEYFNASPSPSTA